IYINAHNIRCYLSTDVICERLKAILLSFLRTCQDFKNLVNNGSLIGFHIGWTSPSKRIFSKVTHRTKVMRSIGTTTQVGNRYRHSENRSMVYHAAESAITTRCNSWSMWMFVRPSHLAQSIIKWVANWKIVSTTLPVIRKTPKACVEQ